MREIAALVLALVLFAAQAAIVAVGLFAPNVSPQYRAVFIDKTSTDWLREPAHLKPAR